MPTDPPLHSACDPPPSTTAEQRRWPQATNSVAAAARRPRPTRTEPHPKQKESLRRYENRGPNGCRPKTKQSLRHTRPTLPRSWRCCRWATTTRHQRQPKTAAARRSRAIARWRQRWVTGQQTSARLSQRQSQQPHLPQPPPPQPPAVVTRRFEIGCTVSDHGARSSRPQGRGQPVLGSPARRQSRRATSTWHRAQTKATGVRAGKG